MGWLEEFYLGWRRGTAKIAGKSFFEGIAKNIPPMQHVSME
jgi:hypothetical protein